MLFVSNVYAWNPPILLLGIFLLYSCFSCHLQTTFSVTLCIGSYWTFTANMDNFLVGCYKKCGLWNCRVPFTFFLLFLHCLPLHVSALKWCPYSRSLVSGSVKKPIFRNIKLGVGFWRELIHAHSMKSAFPEWLIFLIGEIPPKIQMGEINSLQSSFKVHSSSYSTFPFVGYFWQLVAITSNGQ